jgi:hypothetical protein
MRSADSVDNRQTINGQVHTMISGDITAEILVVTPRMGVAFDPMRVGLAGA